MSRLLLTCALLFYTAAAFGQGQPAQAASWQEKFFKSPETVLPILIDAALRYSAQLENLDAAQQLALANQHLERRPDEPRPPGVVGGVHPPGGQGPAPG